MRNSNSVSYPEGKKKKKKILFNSHFAIVSYKYSCIFFKMVVVNM